MKKELKDDYRRSLKSMDTEEGIDLAFYRPIGYRWAVLASRFGISPNAITIAAIFLGIGAGILFYFPNLWLNVAGMVLLIWANSFDSADGQLARLTKQYSRIGRILHNIPRNPFFWLFRLTSMGDMDSGCHNRALPHKAGSYGRLLSSVPSLFPEG